MVCIRVIVPHFLIVVTVYCRILTLPLRCLPPVRPFLFKAFQGLAEFAGHAEGIALKGEYPVTFIFHPQATKHHLF